MLDLQDKHVVVMGVASESSIAWAMAKAYARAGARVSLGYQMRFRSRVLQLVKTGEVTPLLCERCDVTNPEELSTFFAALEGPIDVLVHSIAYASPETFAKRISEITAAEFAQALTTSAYSLLPLVAAAKTKFSRDASVIAMTYLGGQRVVANYKLMGIAKAALEATVRELASDVGRDGVRVNAISAGPVKTLASSQVGGMDKMLEVYEAVAPLKRSITQDDVADMALFLGSRLSRNVTGQTLFVDAGYSTLAMAEM